MPKHALVPTRDKPLNDPTVGGSSSTAQSLVPSNEVLLRSKIAQLEGKGKRRTASGGAGPATSSSSATGGGRSTRKASSGGSNGRLPEAFPAQKGAGEKGGRSRGGAGGGGAAAAGSKSEGHFDASRRFEAQVALARKPRDSENDSTEDLEREAQCYSFTPESIKALQKLYQEQVPTTKRTDALARKTRDMEASNKAMRAEAETCAQDAVRLEQAAAKLHAVSVELDGRRSSLLESRKVAAADEATRRDEMNAKLNAIVSGISTKIKEQEEERIAQDKENLALRAELQALLQDYEDQKNASTEALKAQEDEAAASAQRLDELTAAAMEEELRQDGLRKEVEALIAGEEVLRRRVGEHASRLQRQEAGLKTHFDSIQRLQVEEAELKSSIARLSKTKRALLSRAGCTRAGAGGRDDGGEGAGDTADSELGEEELRALAHQKAKNASDLASEKERLQARCRELQGERKRVTSAVESLVAITAEGKEEQSVEDGRTCPSHEEKAVDTLSTS